MTFTLVSRTSTQDWQLLGVNSGPFFAVSAGPGTVAGCQILHLPPLPWAISMGLPGSHAVGTDVDSSSPMVV